MKKNNLILAIFIALVTFISCNKDEEIPVEVSIATISPELATIGDIITLNGQNFDTTEIYTVYFNNLEGVIIEVSETYVKVEVPERAASGEITLNYNGKTINAGFITITNIFTGEVELLTQQDVDDFGAHNYSAVDGRLLIGDDRNPTPESIVSLEPLWALTLVSSSLRIEYNTALTNVDGLNNIKETGNLLLEYNDALTNVNGLSSLTTTLGFYIYGNPLLTTIEGLSKLTLVDYLYINGNASLTTLNGLQSLAIINETLEISRTALTNIDALSNITSLEYDLEIVNNEVLTSIDGLSNLMSVGEGIYIENNTILTNLEGFTGLTTVGEEIYIYNNNALLNADGLSNLTTVGGDLEFYENDLMSNYCGLNTLIIDNSYTDFRASSNAYNPTTQDIIDGNCSQ